jgi:hypothetical protein
MPPPGPAPASKAPVRSSAFPSRRLSPQPRDLDRAIDRESRPRRTAAGEGGHTAQPCRQRPRPDPLIGRDGGHGRVLLWRSRATHPRAQRLTADPTPAPLMGSAVTGRRGAQRGCRNTSSAHAAGNGSSRRSRLVSGEPGAQRRLSNGLGHHDRCAGRARVGSWPAARVPLPPLKRSSHMHIVENSRSASRFSTRCRLDPQSAENPIPAGRFSTKCMLRAAAAAGDGGSPDPAPGDPRHRPGPHPFVAAVDLPPPGRPPGRPDGARVS